MIYGGPIECVMCIYVIQNYIHVYTCTIRYIQTYSNWIIFVAVLRKSTTCLENLGATMANRPCPSACYAPLEVGPCGAVVGEHLSQSSAPKRLQISENSQNSQKNWKKNMFPLGQMGGSICDGHLPRKGCFRFRIVGPNQLPVWINLVCAVNQTDNPGPYFVSHPILKNNNNNLLGQSQQVLSPCFSGHLLNVGIPHAHDKICHHQPSP